MTLLFPTGGTRTVVAIDCDPEKERVFLAYAGSPPFDGNPFWITFQRVLDIVLEWQGGPVDLLLHHDVTQVVARFHLKPELMRELQRISQGFIKRLEAANTKTSL